LQKLISLVLQFIAGVIKRLRAQLHYCACIVALIGHRSIVTDQLRDGVKPRARAASIYYLEARVKCYNILVNRNYS